MRRILFLGLLPLIAAWAIACTVGANVGELGASASDAGEDGSAATDGELVTEADASTSIVDAGRDAEPPIDAGCGVSFGQRGDFVDVGVVMGPPPNLNGGPIAAGLYELTALRVYFGAETGTMQVRETMRVRGSTTAGAFDRLTEARNAVGSFEAYPLRGETHTFEVGAGPTIFVAPECPAPDLEHGTRFDVTGTTFTLFDDVTATERVYRRVE
ncbi:MAG: hypothetical protein KIS78_08320 [Labilithrix sp.]|nr:hypothetical protein [Labilithrix sp.]